MDTVDIIERRRDLFMRNCASWELRKFLCQLVEHNTFPLCGRPIGIQAKEPTDRHGKTADRG
jgi:hypothetical protein